MRGGPLIADEIETMIVDIDAGPRHVTGIVSVVIGTVIETTSEGLARRETRRTEDLVTIVIARIITGPRRIANPRLISRLRDIRINHLIDIFVLF